MQIFKLRTDMESDTGRSHDPEVEALIESHWLNEKMRDCRIEYTTKRDIHIVCGTWNVNGKKFDESENLEDWLFGTSPAAAQQQPDVFALGFQEIVDLTAVNVAMESNTVKRSKEWHAQIEACLSHRGAYTAVLGQHLVGLYLCIFVKTDIAPFVSDARSAFQGVGLMGMLGNKGGVGIRLNIFDNSYCFICAHLAAHRENVSGRNNDARNIINRLVFNAARDEDGDDDGGDKDVDAGAAGGSSGKANTNATAIARSRSAHAAARGEPIYGAKMDIFRHLGVYEHETVFFIGDLNYRIDERLKMQDIFDSIESGDARRLQVLRDNDQLNIERHRKSGTVFDAFHEGVLNFAPTYKYQPGTHHYDRRPEKKVRAPAWCDRVLWRTDGDDNNLKQVAYTSVNKYTCSDHKPVRAVFLTMARVIVPDKERQIFSELTQKIRQHSAQPGGNTMRKPPSVEVQGAMVTFAKFRYGEQQSAVVALRNSGNSVVHWRFMEKYGEEDIICRRWVEVKPAFGLLMPGEVAQITVTGTLDKKTINSLNQGSETLYDVLVLRVERSFDHYIRVVGQQLPSCLGMSLAALVTLRSPVRSAPMWDAERVAPPVGSGVQWVPKEIWRLVNLFVENRTLLDTPGLFVHKPPLTEFVAVVEALDTGAAFPESPALPLSAAMALVVLVDSFSSSVVAPSIVPTEEKKKEKDKDKDSGGDSLAASTSNPANQVLCARLLNELPAVEYNTLLFLVSFFKEVFAHSDMNLITMDRLVEVLASSLMGCLDDWNPAADGALATFKNLLTYMITI